MAVQTLPTKHAHVLEESVRDIIENQERNPTYIQQTLHFLRYMIASTFLQGGGRLKMRDLWDQYTHLARYSSEVLTIQPKRRADHALPTIQGLDRIARYQMQQIGVMIDGNDAPIVLTDAELAELRAIAAESRAEPTQATASSALRPLSSTDPVTLALGDALGIDLR